MNMRERIARAIDPSYWESFDQYCAAKEWSPAEIAEERAESRGVKASLSRADAVLAAMAGPTKAMIEAGNLPGWDDCVTIGLSEAVWTVMLAAAGEPE